MSSEEQDINIEEQEEGEYNLSIIFNQKKFEEIRKVKHDMDKNELIKPKGTFSLLNSLKPSNIFFKRNREIYKNRFITSKE